MTLPLLEAAITRRAGLRNPLAWFGALVLVAIVAQAGWDIVRSRERTVQATARDLDAQARVIAEQTARAVQAIDVVIESVVEQLQGGWLAQAAPDTLHEYLREKARGLVQSDGLAVFDADGSLRAVSQVPAARLPAKNFADDPPFMHIRDSTRGELHIDHTVVSPGTLRWVVPIGRRLTDRQGRFAGVVGAVGRVDYFQQFYRDTFPDPTVRVALAHRDGTLLARNPPVESALGQPIAGLAQLLPASPSAPAQVRHIPSPVDGVDHFVAVRLVPDYPLAVAVSREAAAALAPWRQQALTTAWRTLVLVALAGGLLVVVLRQLARLHSARESLQVSEARYAFAMTGSDEGHWLWDIAHRQVFVSARLAQMFALGNDALELADEDYFARIPLHPEDRERVHHNRNQHVAGLTPRLDHEFRVVVPGSGEVRWVHTRAQCFRDPDGRPLRLAGSTVDVTARKNAEAALRESEERFAVAVAGADDGIWDWNYATGMAFASGRGRRMFGLPPAPEQLPLAQWFAEASARVHPEDRARRQAAIDDHLAGHTPAYECDFRVLQTDGSYRWMHVHGRCVRDADGKITRVAGSASDIDDRKRAEEALRASEERYALAMRGSRGGHWVWNVDTDAIFISDAMRELFELPADAPLGSRTAYTRHVHLHPDDRQLFGERMADLMSGRLARADYEFRILLRDGTTRWILTRAQRFAEGDDKQVRIAGVSVDVSERKRADTEHERLEQQLRQAQKLEAIGTLAGGIAHDFNNILSAILGYGELAQRDAPEGSRQRRHIDAAIGAGQRAKSLVERILAFSRSGMAERVPVHVQPVLDEALDAVAATLPRGVCLRRAVATGDAGVTGDATQLHQVVLNLCANAVQALRESGEIEVTAAVQTVDAPLPVATCTLAPGRYVRIGVRDSGSGIAPEVLERIFDPFFTTKEVGVGTGLGLSLVHGIVADLGGGIDVVSRVGAGSTFGVWLPSTVFVAGPAAAETPPALGEGQTVLLVDDEESLVRLGEEMLAELGYEPVGFASSEAALQAFEADPERFDIVLSDEAMPGLTGSELAAALRRRRPRLPIVLMSGFVSPALAQRARELGVGEVLAKPLAARDIARALAAALKPRLIVAAK